MVVMTVKLLAHDSKHDGVSDSTATLWRGATTDSEASDSGNYLGKLLSLMRIPFKH
jgi:hypothetical protein